MTEFSFVIDGLFLLLVTGAYFGHRMTLFGNELEANHYELWVSHGKPKCKLFDRGSTSAMNWLFRLVDTQVVVIE